MTGIYCKRTAMAVVAALAMVGCGKAPDSPAPAAVTHAPPVTTAPKPPSYASVHLKDYAEVTLGADLSGYSADEKQMLVKLIAAGKIMDDLYWQQTYGDKDTLLG